MDEPRCETCRYFDPAHSCVERPTWGHCRQNVRPGDKKSLGLFTWADDVCEYVKPRFEPAQPRPTSRIAFLPGERRAPDPQHRTPS